MKNKLFKITNLTFTLFFIFLFIFSIPIYASSSNEVEVIPGGEAIGIKLSCRGVLIVGYADDLRTNDISESKLMIGDIITKINSKEISTSKELINELNKNHSNSVLLTISRNNKQYNKNITLIRDQNGNNRLGIWVRDTTAGVGTMTFYSKDTSVFGALGHPVIDSDTKEFFQIKNGSLLKSTVISIKKGQKGDPGELRGIFIDDKSPLGYILCNSQCGIFGKLNNNSTINKQPIKVASRNEIKTGPATIITTIDESGPKEYKVIIEKLFNQSEPASKSMIIRIIDEDLINKTGGIVQGMSGSPIIQNNKIVGAVTHVLINKPDTGYGIYIDWMIEESKIY